jgi:thioredoxin-dependent peroxiredoxin
MFVSRIVGHQSARRIAQYACGMKRNDVVPDFELPDQHGTPRRLTELLADGPVVLFFYPAAMTTGCTKESCHFRDLAAEFKEVGAQRVGISTDSVDKQRRFADLHDFDYPLLSDADGTVARMFGVKRRIGQLPLKRTTFVIDTDRSIVEVIASELNMDKHADQALAVLRARR